MATSPRKSTKPKVSGAPLADPVTEYAAGVRDGRYPAGPFVRDACARHFRDLEAGKWTFDLHAVKRVIDYFHDVLILNGGEFEGVPFHLLPWQAFIVGSLFGWRAHGTGEDGLPNGPRRFRMAFVEAGKGSGKSPLAAGIGLYMQTADGEQRAEIYAAASKKDQAQVLFRDAVAMVRQSPQLNARCKFSGGLGKEWNIAYHRTGSWFRPISSDAGQSGPRPHAALLDEIHEHPDNSMVELLRAGTKGRRQALIFMITNSGSSRTSVCYEYHEYSRKVCAGLLEDEAFFAYVCSLDEGEDPFESEDCWPKANPSLGITIQVQYLREQVQAARGLPSKAAIVRRLNFCEWTDAETPWIDRDKYDGCLEEFDPDDMIGLPCWLGLDLSSKRDLTALAAAWLDDDGSILIHCWFWSPGETAEEREKIDNVPYRVWEQEGYLTFAPGRLIDKLQVAMFVQELAAKHDIKGLAYDQAQMDEFLKGCDQIGLDAWIQEKKEFDGIGLKLVRHAQGYQGYSNPDVLWMPASINFLEEIIMGHRARIQNNPILRYCSASAVLEPDLQNNRKWNKRKSRGRIDGIVAACMASGLLNRETTAEDQNIPEDYELMVMG